MRVTTEAIDDGFVPQLEVIGVFSRVVFEQTLSDLLDRSLFAVHVHMKRTGDMHWTPEGANSLLQVRCGVLNGPDIRKFKR